MVELDRARCWEGRVQSEKSFCLYSVQASSCTHRCGFLEGLVLIALYFLTVLLFSFSDPIFSLLWSHSSPSWSRMGLQKDWVLGGNCIINCDRVIAWLSLQMSFLIFTNKQTHLNGVYFAFPVSWSRCILSSESCPRDTWDVHMHKTKDSFCCFRNPSKSHLRTFTDLKQCQRGSTDTWRNLTELLQSRGINRNKCQPLPPLHFVMSYLWIISFFVFFPLPIFWRGPVLMDQFYS